MSNETELEVPSSRMAELVAAEARLPELELALRSIAEYELEVLNEIGAGVCAFWMRSTARAVVHPKEAPSAVRTPRCASCGALSEGVHDAECPAKCAR